MVMTAAEIGRLVGCSTATVSRAINNSGSVAPETRDAIFRMLRETQYVPQRTGRRRKGRAAASASSTRLVHILYHRHSPFEPLTVGQGGVNVGPLHRATQSNLRSPRFGLADSFWRSIIDGAVAELACWDHKAVLDINTDLKSPQLISDLNEPGKEGVLIVGEASEELREIVAKCRHPLVLADHIYDQTHDVVTVDNLAGISTAFDHIYSLGHRRIGFVGRVDSNFAYAERFNAFSMKMASHSLPVRTEWVYEGYSHIEAAAAGVKKILSRADRPTALICSSDCVAIGALRAATSLGIAVPEELSIIGFDDIDAASLVTPPLTTLHVPAAEIGRQSVRLLMIQARSPVGSQRIGCRVRLVPRLVIRGSTGPAPAGDKS